MVDCAGALRRMSGYDSYEPVYIPSSEELDSRGVGRCSIDSVRPEIT